MNICIPVENNKDLTTKVNAHFGSAPYFLIYDANKATFEIIDNRDKHHIHGMCHPLKTLENRDINIVVCIGMGARAVQKLNEDGIRAYKTEIKTANEVIKKYKKGVLKEITITNACNRHNCQ